RSVVSVFAKVDAVVVGNGAGAVRRWLNIVDSAPVVVVAPTKQNAQFLLWPKSLAEGRAPFTGIAAVHNRRIPAKALENERGRLAVHLRFQIIRTADAVAVHIGF